MNALSFIVRTVRHTPHRTVLLLLGFSVGVMVMVVLLSVGNAILEQAVDPDLTGGGDVVLLPAGIDVSVLKTGGLTAKYFDIPNARYLTREVVTPRRFHGIRAASPELAPVAGYLFRGGDRYLLRMEGVVPSRYRAIGFSAPDAFDDSPRDRRYLSPTPEELLAEIDAFHRPDPEAGGTWTEWHYFNFYDPAGGRSGYISFSAVADDSTARDGAYARGVVLFEMSDHGRRRRIVDTIPGERVHASTSGPTLVVGPDTVATSGGVYHVSLSLSDSLGRTTDVTLDLVPQPHQYIAPLTAPGQQTPFGYVVPVVRGRAHVRVGGPDGASAFEAVGYHDHNWGRFDRAAWNWGVVRAGDHALLYGRFARSVAGLTDEPLFVALFDAGGPAAFDVTNDYRTDWTPAAASASGAGGRGAGGTGETAGAPPVMPARIHVGVTHPPRHIDLAIDVGGAFVTSLAGGGALSGANGADATWFFQVEGPARLSVAAPGDTARTPTGGHGFAEVFYRLQAGAE